MTLDEAIKHSIEQADVLGVCDCSSDHMQLAMWLKELKHLRKLWKESQKKTFEVEYEIPPMRAIYTIDVSKFSNEDELKQHIEKNHPRWRIRNIKTIHIGEQNES